MAAGSRPWSQKFADAFRGVWRAVRTQTSFAVHLVMAGAVVAAGALFRVTAGEWCLLVLAIGLVLMAEVFNTGIESLARAPGSRRHPRLRDALDMASAAVLVAAITAGLIGLIVFGPRLIALL
ncbi:MAG: diacylglycerol kinase [Planctomycetia bacterium]